MRVILDTNILLSGPITPGGAPGQLIGAWRGRRFTVVSHALQLEEVREVSRRDKFRPLMRSSQVGRLVTQIAATAEMPERLPIVQRSPDPRDDFLLALCEAGAVDRLVTGDKADLLALKRHGPAWILTAAAFLAELDA